MRVIGLQPLYLPWAGMFDMMDQCDLLIFSDDVQFVKGSWQCRNRIKTPDGVKWVSVSVDRTVPSTTLIKDIRVKHEVEWIKRNLSQIKEAYRKAPYFQPLFKDLTEILERKDTHLETISVTLIKYLAAQLGIYTPCMRASELGIQARGAERKVRVCKAVGATECLDGASGRELYDTDFFFQHGIRLFFHEYEHPVYSQLYGEFVSHLSVIDLLFNEGPNARDILRSGRTSSY